MQGIIDWVLANKAVLLGVLFVLSEGLALVPSVKANSVFQLIFGWLQKEQAPPAA